MLMKKNFQFPKMQLSGWKVEIFICVNYKSLHHQYSFMLDFYQIWYINVLIMAILVYMSLLLMHSTFYVIRCSTNILYSDFNGPLVFEKNAIIESK